MLRHAHKGIFASLFIVMLLLATFSLVLTDWTGSFRAGTGTGDIAKMKGDRITAPEFTTMVSRVARAENMNPQDAYDRGLVNQILTSEIWQRMLNLNAHALGVQVGDDQLLDHVKAIATPIADQQKAPVADVIKRYIQQQGMTEAAFLGSMRRDLENDLVRGVISAGGVPSAFVRDDMIAFDGQKRTARYVVLKDETVDVPAPTEDQIKSYYESRVADFMLPERRDVQVMVLSRSNLAQKAEVTDDAIAEYFNVHKDEMVRPETRTVEFAVFKDKKDAAAAVSLVKGKDFKKTILKKWPKVTVEKTDFERADALPDYLKPAFDAKVGAVVGPVQTPLGVYVMRVDRVTDAGAMTLDQARGKITAALRDEAISDHADKVMDDLNAAIDRGDDMATIAKAFGLTTKTIVGLGRDGKGADGADLMADYASVKAPMLSALFTGTETGRALSPIELPNGDIAVVAVTSIAATHPQDLASVKGKLMVDYIATKKREANMVAAQGMLTDWIAEKTDLAKIAAAKSVEVQTISDARRDAKNVPGSLDRRAWARLFNMPAGVPIMEPVSSGMMFAVVDHVALADPKAASADDVKAATESLQRAQAEEQMVGYMGALSDRYAPRVNDALVRRLFERKSAE